MTVVEAIERFTDSVGLTFEHNCTEKYDEFIAKNSSITGIDDDVHIDVTYYKNETLEVHFTFDTLERTPQSLSLIEAFNESSPFLTGYISEKRFFIVVARNLTVTDPEDAENFLHLIFRELIEKKAYLEPITKLTV